MKGTVNEKNYSIKTFLCDAALLGFALLSMLLLTMGSFTTWVLAEEATVIKKILFLSLDILLARMSYRAVKNSNRQTQICLVAAVAVVITVGSILLNNVWHYIQMDQNYEWLKPLSFWWVLGKDVTYLYGFGLYRYALVCIGYIISFYLLKEEFFRQFAEYVFSDNVLDLLGIERTEDEEEDEE